MTNSEPDFVLDPAVLDTLRGLAQDDQPDVLGEVLRLFLHDADARIETIAAAMAAGDGPALQRAAHALKGAAASIGAPRLQAACRALEEAGRTGAMNQSSEALASVRREHALVRQAIDQLL